MNRNLKALNSLFVAVLLSGMLVACSSNPGDISEATPTSVVNEAASEQTTVPENDATKDPYVITLAMPVFGAIPPDMAEVQTEISKITKAKINATVEILPISIGAWQQQMNLMMSGGEKLDLAFTFGASYPTQAGNGQLIPIDELVKQYGQGLEQAIGADYVQSARIDGKLYGVPTIHDFAGQNGMMMRKDLVEKHKIDVASIKKLDDLDKVFQTIKDNEPGIAPLGIGLASPLEVYLTYDKLGDRLGVLPGFDNDLQVVNLYESDEYAKFLQRLHGWFKAGYINKDAATNTTTNPQQVRAGAAFSYFTSWHPAMTYQETLAAGQELVYVPLQEEHYATTSKVMVALWGISQNSENPERAMMFLDLMYTDKDIANLLLWGIEGKHYVKVSDTTVDYPAGVDPTTVGYSNQAWLLGNPFLTYTYKSDDPQVWNKVKAYNESAVKSKALGFTFNTEPVGNEITAINNAVQQYGKALESGTMDPAKRLPEFISKLKAAGIDKVIAEKQKQLNEWASQR